MLQQHVVLKSARKRSNKTALVLQQPRKLTTLVLQQHVVLKSARKHSNNTNNFNLRAKMSLKETKFNRKVAQFYFKQERFKKSGFTKQHVLLERNMG